jgi:WD40 repeat protein
MANTEAVVRWTSPFAEHASRFLTINLNEKVLRLYQVTQNRGTNIEFDEISHHTKLPDVAAFDWSPKHEQLVAIGVGSGEVALLKIDDGSNEVISIPVKYPRSCNAIAFNTEGKLAAGLGKVRNDHCLNIWDVNQRLFSWDRDKNNGYPPNLEPFKKLAPSEPISSIKFFEDQPDVLVAGVRNQCVRIYDLRGIFFLKTF